MRTHDRRKLVPHAIAQFQNQDYPDKELIIVGDGADPIGDLVPSHRNRRLIRLSGRLLVGAKRNIACESTTGRLIAYWGDDDWNAPHRIPHQISASLL